MVATTAGWIKILDIIDVYSLLVIWMSTLRHYVVNPHIFKGYIIATIGTVTTVFVIDL